MSVTDGLNHAEWENVFVVANAQNQSGIEFMRLSGSDDTHQNLTLGLASNQRKLLDALRAGDCHGHLSIRGQASGGQPHALTVRRIDDFKDAFDERALDRDRRRCVVMPDMGR